MIAHVEKIDGLGPAWCFTDKGQFAAIRQRVDGRGFAGVGATGKGDFRAHIRRHVGGLVDGVSKLEL